MAWIAKHLLCGPDHCFYQGQAIVDVSPERIKKWAEEGLIEPEDKPAVGVLPGLEDLFRDELDECDMPKLVAIYKLNNLQTAFKPLKTWSEEQFREMLRSVLNLKTCKLPWRIAEEPAAPAPAPAPAPVPATADSLLEQLNAMQPASGGAAS